MLERTFVRFKKRRRKSKTSLERKMKKMKK